MTPERGGTCPVPVYFLMKSTLMSRALRARSLRFAGLVLLLVALFATGLSMRQAVLRAQVDAVGPDLPFTLESALHYRRVKMLYDRGELPEIDRAIQHPEGVRIAAIDAVASEPFQAALARLFPASIPFPDRIRWIEAGWFSLSMPLLMLLLRAATGSWTAGAVAGLLDAVALAAVLRSTGQEISRENFAMPWLIACAAASAAALRAPHPRALWSWGILAGWLGFRALAGWDMIQYPVGLLALAMSLYLVRRRERVESRVLVVYGLLVAGVLVIAVTKSA